MASIHKRESVKGDITWRVIIRRKGLPTFCTCFVSKDEAIDFVKEYEHKYCLDHKNFDFDRLRQIRENEFKKRGVI